jgi:site-specific DNA recombinase
VETRTNSKSPLFAGQPHGSSGSVSRVPAADIEDIVVKFLKKHFAAKQSKLDSGALYLEDRDALSQLVARIVVHEDKLIVQLKSQTPGRIRLTR